MKPRERVEVIIAVNSRLFEQLNVCLKTHICDLVVTILKIFINFSKRGLQAALGKHANIGASRGIQCFCYQLDLKVLVYVSTDYFNFVVWSLFKVVDD